MIGRDRSLRDNRFVHWYLTSSSTSIELTMAQTYADLKVRLLQVRKLPAIRDEEQQSFIDRCGLAPHQLLVTDVLTQPLSPDVLDGVDAVLIGGAGAYSVTQTYDWTPDLIALVQTIRDRSIPLFGSCWGHQFIARALGGTVIPRCGPKRNGLPQHHTHGYRHH